MNYHIKTKSSGAAIAAIAVIIILLSNASAEDIYICNCSGLDTDGATYYLTQDIINSGTTSCMNILANNVTLDCQYHTIDGNDIAYNGINIYRSVSETTNITIKNCFLSDWSNANINLEKAYGNVIENIITTSSSYGIKLIHSNYNTITNITAINNNDFGVYFLYSDHNTISDSISNGNHDGIYLFFGDLNTIKNSRIEDNSRWGICFSNSDMNKVYNNLFNNSVNYQIYISVGNNYWNTTRKTGSRIYSEGVEIGGNYWTNLSGLGYSDTCIDTDNDGFCDYNYTLFNNNIDYLPLSNQYELPLPDLIITAINAYHTMPYTFPWFNLSNNVEVTVTNNGIHDVENFNLSLYINDTFFTKSIVSYLDAGNSTSVIIKWTPVGCDCVNGCNPETFVLKAIADCDDDIIESNESNNESTFLETAYWNGYAADDPLDNFMHGKLRGGLLFTTGDSNYGKLNPGSSRTGAYNINLSQGAQVEHARLNVYYTWTYPEGSLPEMEVNVTNQTGTYTLSASNKYNDRKCWHGYDLYWGNWVYDVTQYIQGNGLYNITVKCTQSSGYVYPAGPGLVVLYKDETKPFIEYWLNEGADLLLAYEGKVYPYEAITNASFIGCIDGNVTNASLGIVNPWANTLGTCGELFFNNISLGKDVYCGGMRQEYCYLSNNVMTIEVGGSSQDLQRPQVAVCLMDVKEHLNNCDNYAGIGDICDSGMLPSNAFLVVEYESEPFICGDVNGNGEVNMGDVTLLGNYVGYPGNPRYAVHVKAADVNNNSEVNMGDVTLLGNHVGYPDNPLYFLKCGDE